MDDSQVLEERKIAAKKRVRTQKIWFFIFISPWLIGFLGLTVGPMIYSFIMSFTDKIISTIKNSLILSIKHLFFSFLSILIIFMGVFITIFYPKIVGYGIIVVLIGFSLTSYCIAFLMNRVFQPYR